MSVAKLATNGWWAVNGTPIYTPTDSEIEHENMVSSDSGRTESGKMHITWIRRDIVKVNLTFKYLTGEEVRYMLDRMQGQEFTFTYYDDGTKTISAYVGKCSYKQHNLTLHASEGGLYEDFKINVIEM